MSEIRAVISRIGELRQDPVGSGFAGSCSGRYRDVSAGRVAESSDAWLWIHGSLELWLWGREIVATGGPRMSEGKKAKEEGRARGKRQAKGTRSFAGPSAAGEARERVATKATDEG